MSDLLAIIRKHVSLANALLACTPPKYLFVTNEYFETFITRKQFATANRFYAAELVAHLHIAAMITLKRHSKWLHGVETAVQARNYFAFCACLRGFIESAADSFFSLRLAPQTVVEHFSGFRQCLDGKETVRLVICEPLENLAIHFLQAGKHEDKTQEAEHFKAKKCVEYIDSIDEGDSAKPIYALYQKLCQISHPARPSAWMFLTQHGDGTFSVKDTDDSEMIRTEWLEAHEPTYRILFQKSFNASFLTLFFLDKLASDYIPCPPIREFDFSAVDGFKRMESELCAKIR